MVDCDEFFKDLYYREAVAAWGSSKLRRSCRVKFATYAEMSKGLEETEAMSSREMKKLSEKQRTIQEQEKLLIEKEKEGSTDESSAKDKEIMADAEYFEGKVPSHADISERLEESEAVSTKAMNELSVKEKIIQEQVKLIE